MTSAYSINLNFNNTIPVKTDFTFKQGDKGITLNLATTGLDTTGTTAHIVFKRSNGTSVEAELTGQTGPSYSYTILGNEFEIPGVVVADLKLYNGDTQRVSTASFIFLVTGDTMDGVGSGTGGYSDQLEELSAEFQDTLDDYIDAFGNTAPINPRGDYDNAETYEPRDMVYDPNTGTSWVAKVQTTGHAPASPSSYWQKLVNSSGSFAGLSDVVITTPTNGQVPTYNSTSGKWENATPTTGGMLPHVVVTTTAGSTLTATLGGTTINLTETSSGTYEGDLTAYGLWTITAQSSGSTFTKNLTVDAVKVYTTTMSLFSATITVNYPDNMRGQAFACTMGGTTLTETAPNNANTFDFIVSAPGTWTVTGAYSKSAAITTDGETQSLTFYALKTFASATDQEIADMVSEADSGYIDLYEDAGWAVGQEHSVSLDAIAASGTYDGVSWTVNESQGTQTATLVLMHKGLYELVNSVLDKQGQTRTICSFVVGIKDCLSTQGYLNSTNTNTGSWDASARRAWCNGGLREAIPSALRGKFKKFKAITGDYNGTSAGGTNITSQDYFTLPAEKEVFGSASYSTTNEAEALTQFTWYATAANRIKKIGENARGWWTRSPYKGGNASFCVVGGGGTAVDSSAGNNYGLSPFGCL